MILPRVATIVGSGTMGPGIAATLAHAGVQVRVYDISAEAIGRAQSAVEGAKSVLTELNGDPKEGGSIVFSTDLTESLKDTGFVIEAVPEKLALKEKVLAQIEEHVTDDVIIATNTSGIPISTMAATMKRASRFIGMHWSNPPHLIPMVEIIPGSETDISTTDRLMSIVEGFNYLPVPQKEKPGFVENRVLYAILRECVALLEEGVVSPEGLDTCVKWGIGYKLSVVGPTRLLDMAGLDIYEAVSSYLNEDLDSSTHTAKLVTDRVAEGKLGFKTEGGLYEYGPGDVEKKRTEIVRGLVEARKTLSAIHSV